MRKMFMIAAAILTLVSGAFFLFVLHKNGKPASNKIKTHLTTSAIIKILSDVNPPYPNTNTLLLETGMKLCGMTPNGFEMPIPPQSQDLPFVEKLRTISNSKAPSGEESDRILDTIVIYSVLNSKNDFSENKLYVLVSVQQSKKDGRLLVYENFLYSDIFKLVVKEFRN
jgi:hypothetical protein